MLQHIHRLARRLLPIRPVLIGFVACGLVGAAVGLFAFPGNEGDHILLPATILVLWAVTGLIFVDVFAPLQGPLGPNPNVQRSHWSSKLREGLHWALILGFLVLALTVADLSLHLAHTWLMDGSR
jgi:hypothetical protein